MQAVAVKGWHRGRAVPAVPSGPRAGAIQLHYPTAALATDLDCDGGPSLLCGKKAMWRALGTLMERAMKKNHLNFVIDALMFLCLMAIAGIGFLMNWVLLPGRERAAVYGGSVDLCLFGLDRHQWGNIHLVVGLVLLGLLVLHTILHWKQIVHLFCRLVSVRATRIVIAVVFLAISIALIAFPLIVKPEVVQGASGDGHGYSRGHGRHLVDGERTGTLP